MTALLVSINISFYYDCYYNDVFMLSVGSALVALQNDVMERPLSNLPEAGDDGATLLVSINISFYFDCYYNDVLCYQLAPLLFCKTM